jgi:cytidylate kinase
MKKLIFICGANGIGKSTVSKALHSHLPNSVCIDSEYCCSINPFELNHDTIELFKANISALMINSFTCDFIETVIFPYGFHGPRKEIFDSVIQNLRNSKMEYELHPVILECEETENFRRMRNDNRDEKRIERALKHTRQIYDELDYPRINTTELTVSETVERILKLI